MLSIPAAIEALIKSDNVRKNFRVKFPNGEHADLTNDDIVAESVRFQESVCSGETFKFGSADSSVIEFETVGVPNILGMTIQCVMEYAVPAALQATYGTWYGIPYGVFVVDSCPRDHQSMAHRKVTAYSRKFSNADLPAFEQWKMSEKCTAKYYDLKPYYLLAGLGIVTPGTETALTGTTGSSDYTAFLSIKTSYEYGQLVYRRLYGIYPAGTYEEITVSSLDAVYAIKLTGSLQPLYTIMENHNIPQSVPLATATVSITNPGQTEIKFHVPLKESGGYIVADPVYPQAPQIEASAVIKLMVPKEIQVKYTDSQVPSLNWDETATIATASEVKQLTDSSDETGIVLRFQRTLETSSGNYFYNCYSFREIINGFAELTAGMVRANRDGTLTLIHLDNSSPYALTAADVSGSAWWDEYTVDPIGTVKYDWTAKSGNQYNGEYVIDEDGQSAYDMTGNYILNHLQNPTQSYIETTLLETMFKPRAGSAVFTPLDANFRGLTYLQPGDAIQLTAADGAVVDSYLLDQTFSGIQLITLDVNTVQGQVVENEY